MKRIVVTCPECGSKMVWQPEPIREFWCDPCDYLIDWDQVQARGNYRFKEDGSYVRVQGESLLIP